MLRVTPRPDGGPSAFLLVQFLAWVGEAERSSAETMAAWRTSCPRLQVWEEAVEAGLVRLVHDEAATQSETRVALTEAGRATLAAPRQRPGGV